jgi:hypothetical protein
MGRAMRRENYPLVVKLQRGRVTHLAHTLQTSDALRTACGQAGLPQTPWPISGPVTCQRCINQPWAQDQRSISNGAEEQQ